MSDHEVIDVEVVGQELEPVSGVTLFHTNDPGEIIERASVLADKLSAVLRDRKLTSNISGKEHVRVEGWTLLGTMLGVFPVVEWTRPVADGWEARVEARTLAGQVVGAAEAECLRSEKTWKGRDDYALRSMAQTRAVSKALRGPLGFVVTLAGYEATPAEEMPAEGFSQPDRVEGPKPLSAPKSWGALTKMMGAYDEGTFNLLERFVDAARRYLYPQSVSVKELPKPDRDYIFVKVASVVMALHEKFEPSEFPPPSEDDIRAAFANVLDGQELAVPDTSESTDPQATPPPPAPKVDKPPGTAV